MASQQHHLTSLLFVVSCSLPPPLLPLSSPSASPFLSYLLPLLLPFLHLLDLLSLLLPLPFFDLLLILLNRVSSSFEPLFSSSFLYSSSLSFYIFLTLCSSRRLILYSPFFLTFYTNPSLSLIVFPSLFSFLDVKPSPVHFLSFLIPPLFVVSFRF